MSAPVQHYGSGVEGVEGARGPGAAQGTHAEIQQEEDPWLKTSQRAASKKPWDATALDAGHYVRKMKAAVASIKPRIDTGQPRTQNRWRGRNFDTIARRAAERSTAGQAAKNVDIALARVDRSDRKVERQKNQFDTSVNPALIQRRVVGPSWAKDATEWQAPKQTIGRTVQDAHCTAMYSLKPPWVKRLSEDKLLPRGRVRPGNIAVPADNVIEPRGRSPEYTGADNDLCDTLGMGPTPAGILLGLKGIKRGDMTREGVTRSRSGPFPLHPVPPSLPPLSPPSFPPAPLLPSTACVVCTAR
jgi:hypothetical protein